MSSFELNKVLGAVLIAVLVLVVIGKIGDNLVTTGGGHVGGHGGGHGDATVTAKTSVKKVNPLAVKVDEPATEMNIAAALEIADPAKGKRVFGKCKACHTVANGGKNGIGPNLWNIVNRAPGSADGFKYSKALAGMSTKIWNYENLNAFLLKPRNYAKGTKMTFAGLKKDRDRANVITYLRSLSDSPAPLK
jgi:cytochrome c